MRSRPMNDATRCPVVLITADLDATASVPGGRTEREYRLRANYAEAVAEAGGLPLILPFHDEHLEAVLALADGVLVTGTAPGADVAPDRLAFEQQLVGRALAAGLPLLGICHGMQLIGECLGGHVVRDDPKLLAGVTPHIPAEVPDVLAHEVELLGGSRLAAGYPARRARVNSLHRHALADGGRYRVAARADDGVVEAIEGLDEGFCLGVQWHPEYRLTDLDRHILQSFVAQCAARAVPR